MKNLLLLLGVILLGCGCRSPVGSFEVMSELCLRHYDQHDRWPESPIDLMACQSCENGGEKIDWTNVSDFSIEPVSEDEVRIHYVVREWYGESQVSGVVHRPSVEYRIKQGDKP